MERQRGFHSIMGENIENLKNMINYIKMYNMGERKWD